MEDTHVDLTHQSTDYKVEGVEMCASSFKVTAFVRSTEYFAPLRSADFVNPLSPPFHLHPSLQPTQLVIMGGCVSFGKKNGVAETGATAASQIADAALPLPISLRPTTNTSRVVSINNRTPSQSRSRVVRATEEEEAAEEAELLVLATAPRRLGLTGVSSLRKADVSFAQHIMQRNLDPTPPSPLSSSSRKHNSRHHRQQSPSTPSSAGRTVRSLSTDFTPHGSFGGDTVLSEHSESEPGAHLEKLWLHYAGPRSAHMHRHGLLALATDVFNEFVVRYGNELDKQAAARGPAYAAKYTPDIRGAALDRELPFLLPARPAENESQPQRDQYIAFVFRFALKSMKHQQPATSGSGDGLTSVRSPDVKLSKQEFLWGWQRCRDQLFATLQKVEDKTEACGIA